MSLVESALQKARREQGSAAAATGPSSRAASSAGRQPGAEADRSSAAAAGLELPQLPHASRTTLDRAHLVAAGLLPPDDQQYDITNQYRRIKRPLIAAAMGGEADALLLGRSLLLTSAVSGEGKTFTSLNLAMSFSLEKDFNVLLVDGDVAKRGLSESLGLGHLPGLMDLLSDSGLDIASCTVATDVPGLFVLPAGQYRPSAPELLGSARMQSLFAEYLDDHRSCFVIFDSPPILMTAEARSLLPVAGQVVVVVKAGESQKPLVLDALGAIGNNKPTSLILNQLRAVNEPRYGYYHPYGNSKVDQAG
jgi:protein-tyrosine kinase